jgi:glycosyltransferase involved in cell wall biosynthesis
VPRGIQLAVVAPYPRGVPGGQRFRVEQWLSLLPEGRISTEFMSLWDLPAWERLYLPGRIPSKAAATGRALSRRIGQLARATRADVVWLYRGAFPLGPAWGEAALSSRVPLIYDFDDAIWLGDTSQENNVVRRLKSPSKVASIVAHSTMTSVGNDYLADWASQFTPHVTIIPTTIDTSQYVPLPRPVTSRKTIIIGWCGSPTTTRYLEGISVPLKKVLENPGVELVAIGANRFSLDKLPNVRVVPWSPEAEHFLTASFDIGVMPMPDDPWTRGKCGFKALLYGSFAIPTVGSPVGVNKRIVVNGKTGFLAATEEEWKEALEQLVGDGRLRKQMGEAARDRVIDGYSGQKWAPVFSETIEKVYTSRINDK